MDNIELLTIVKKYNIELLVYFGSFQTEYYNKESDIDIAFLTAGTIKIDDQISLLEDLIRFHRKSEIDLIDLRRADPVLRYEVALNGKVLYEKEEGLFERYSLFYIKRLYELKPVIEDELKKIGSAIKEVLEHDGQYSKPRIKL